MTKKEREFHRRTAARCFNEAWDYLTRSSRTAKDDRIMLQLAHASRYHWGLVGTRNEAVGDWQISRVYAALGRPELSLMYAKSSLKTCKKKKLSEESVSAFEAVARAYAVGKDRPLADKYLGLARSQLKTLDLNAKERELFLGQINETEKLIAP